MSDYRRWRVPGGAVFLTVVTYSRQSILTTEPGRLFLRDAIEAVRRGMPFELYASVLLPDHWHLVMQLPPNDADYSTRIKLIKRRYSEAWLAADLPEIDVTPAQEAKGERGVWQSRFWEHLIRDDEDLERCVDYIHWNPRKHGFVSRVSDWPWSSFHRFVQAGAYPVDWGGTAPAAIADRSWGEP